MCMYVRVNDELKVWFFLLFSLVLSYVKKSSAVFSFEITFINVFVYNIYECNK